jgi:hypothetical protein
MDTQLIARNFRNLRISIAPYASGFASTCEVRTTGQVLWKPEEPKHGLPTQEDAALDAAKVLRTVSVSYPGTLREVTSAERDEIAKALAERGKIETGTGGFLIG